MIDTHSHLYVEEFAEDFHRVVQNAKEAGISQIYMPNIDDTTLDSMLEACAHYPGYCFPMLGFHPTSVDAESWHKVCEMKKKLVTGHPYCAIGEVGLDLYWDNTYLAEQKKVLEEQLQWALEWNLPVVIHCREAFPELFEVMRPYKESGLTGIFHSFTGTRENVACLLEYPGFMIGVNGVVTFKKSTLPQVLAEVPLSRLVLETDSPYLSPAPFRGKRNESSYLIKVVEKLATVYGVEMDRIAHITSQNALKVFKTSE